MEITLLTHSKEETQEMAYQIGRVIFKGALITLDGDLGAGKTTFTQGLGKGLGIEDKINSPTFNILKCYFDGRLPLYHIDAYRLEEHVNDDIGLEEVIEGDGVCVVEWSCFIPDMIFEPLEVSIEILDNSDRKLTFKSSYSKYENVFSLLEGMKNV